VKFRYICLFITLILAIVACTGGSGANVHAAGAGATHPVTEVKSPLASALATTDWSTFGRKYFECAPPSGQAWDQFTPDVFYADITGDHIPDALVIGACPTPTSPNPAMVAIFSVTSARQNPHEIGLLPTDSSDYFTGLHLRVDGPAITISGPAYSSARQPLCCPDEELSITYRWQAGHLTKISQTARKLSS